MRAITMRRFMYLTTASAMLLGIFPGCVEKWVLNLATPFLLAPL